MRKMRARKSEVSFNVEFCLSLAGKEVKAGQALVVMSAMKMETSVAAPCNGIIRHVAVDMKDSVEAGQHFMSCCYITAVDNYLPSDKTKSENKSDSLHQFSSTGIGKGKATCYVPDMQLSWLVRMNSSEQAKGNCT